jgi:hypothetical protein
MLASELTLTPTGALAMPTQAEPGFRADAEKLLSSEAHLLLVVGEIASRFGVEYATALDWMVDNIEDEFRDE